MLRFATNPRRLPGLRHALAALTLTGALLATTVPAAHSADYMVHFCKDFDGKPLPLDPKLWTSPQSMPYSGTGQLCDSGGGIGQHMGEMTGSYKPGRSSSWELALKTRHGAVLPMKTAIIRRTVATNDPGYDLWATPVWQVRASYARPAAGSYSSIIEECRAADGCQLPLGDTPLNDRWWDFAPEAIGLEFSTRCLAVGSDDGYCALNGQRRVNAVIHRLSVVVADTVRPTSSVLVGNAFDSGLQKGVRTISAFVEDQDSGVYSMTALIGDKVAGQWRPNVSTCVDGSHPTMRDFTVVAPCPNEQNASLTFDSSAFPDGKNELGGLLSDAGGNVVERHRGDVYFDNVPPPVNVDLPTISGAVSDPRPTDVLTAKVGSWKGADIAYSYQWQRTNLAGLWVEAGTGPTYIVKKDDIDAQLRVEVTAKNADGVTLAASAATAKVRSGATIGTAGLGEEPAGASDPSAPSNGAGGDPSTAQLVVDREQRTVDVKHGAKIVITGRLVDADGQPIADAGVDVFEQLVLTAAPWNKIGTVRTDSQGGYVFRPTTTASRRLRFAFADRRDAANYRATREVLVSVQAGMTISAKRKVVNPGGSIRLRGRVKVDHLPKAGAWVEIQVLDAGVWRTIATRRASSKGLWTFKHRLKQSSGVTFRFRSRLRVVGDVASAESKSMPIRVRVR